MDFKYPHTRTQCEYFCHLLWWGISQAVPARRETNPIQPVETYKCSHTNSRGWKAGGNSNLSHFSWTRPSARAAGDRWGSPRVHLVSACSINRLLSCLFTFAPKLEFCTSSSRPLSSANRTALSPTRAVHTAASFTSIIGNKVKEARVCRLGGGIPADQASV